MPATEFQALSEALQRAGALAEPAEVHGQLCGLACTVGASAGSPWLAEVLRDADADPATQATVTRALDDIAAHTLQALDQGDMSLQLALPNDESPMDERAASLGLWCQGFMHGLSQGVAAPATIESGVTGEIVGDFLEISRAELGEGETIAEAEAAYAELVEFVRVSVQLIFEELHAERDAAGQPH